jgi:hypothetical protein
MSNVEQRDATERVARMERLARNITRYEGRSSDVIVPIQNVSGSDLAHGSAVSLSDIGSDGVLEVTKPDADSDIKYLGHVVGKLLAGAIGKCQIAGVAEALRNTQAKSGTDPIIGAKIGPEEDAFTLGHDQVGARWLCDLYDAQGGYTKVCLVLLQNTDRLVADHQTSKTGAGHAESTPVYEPIPFGNEVTYYPGPISDQWGVGPVKTGSNTNYKLMLDFRRQSGHNHGWFRGEVIEEGGTGQSVGWGPIADIIGIRGPNSGQGNVDLNATTCQLNTGQNSLLFGTSDSKEAVDIEGDYVYGWLVPHIPSQTWRPAVPMLLSELRTIDLDGSNRQWTRECGESDICRLLVDPLRYRKYGPGHITGPHDPTNSHSNYLEWIACNRHDINGIFDMLWYVSCCFSWKVGNMDSDLKSILAQYGALDGWMNVIRSWASTVDALLAALSAFHPTTAALYTTESLALAAISTQYGNHTWYRTTICAMGPCGQYGIDIPYLLTCPYWGQQT